MNRRAFLSLALAPLLPRPPAAAAAEKVTVPMQHTVLLGAEAWRRGYRTVLCESTPAGDDNFFYATWQEPDHEEPDLHTP